MAQGGFYEESAGTTREKREAKLFKVFHIAGWIFIGIAAILLLISITMVPNVIEATKDNKASRLFTLVTWFSGVAAVILIGALFWVIKKRFNVSYDYVFVEDELRITKVFNGRKRKFLTTLKADQILKIGYCEADSYKDCKAGLGGKKQKVVTPNPEPAEGKQFVYVLYSTSLGKELYVLECRQMLLEYLVRAAGITKFTKQ